MIWDQHAKPGGIFSLFLCIGGGIMYQQAPMRVEKGEKTAALSAEDDAFKSDVSVEAHKEVPEEEIDLIEKQVQGAKRRGYND
jgi:hypothetical protein